MNNELTSDNNIRALNDQEKINWFPGHMHKSLNHLKKIKKNLDLVIEVLDARAQKISTNHEINQLFNDKPLLKIYLKSDLADCDQNNLKILSSADVQIKNKIIRLIEQLLADKVHHMRHKGQVNPILQVLVCGLPNVGKSTIINRLIGKKVAQAADIPGWTKSFCRYKFYKNMWVYDTPGVFYKRVEKPQTGYVLALIGAIKRDLIPLKSTLEFAFKYLQQHYCHLLSRLIPETNKDTEFNQFIRQLTQNHNFWAKYQQLDLEKGM